MRHLIKKHTISFKHAFDGVIWSFKTQPNFRIHLLLSLVAIFLSFYLQLETFEWLIILMLIFIGLVIEMINTAIEATTDAIDRNLRQDIAIAKDVAAGAMLTYAIGAIVIASCIFFPKF
ncbi:hypothetical protein A3C23_02790 [Candidatus Roizmanbacteria bacterium RIFCSPHIGHO2_02_FULL_37_13b]|uniref:Diacylglycerol kinase n=1 Tax=Candidatus Roizmanbacteria bacterium RIFCSPLOWO2_02_FULL_36_11 TaxID=1802071 RepID=A0A1F7JG42_9BACT|nr:MAG: hypothetical protein A3C23_02790 [Candidatus Roizmanbacteria bacterium RIFCSPHIGHO2_02_FULL_37_13b]OGK54601.1 MAG: hypothetical protein A3H78_01810 [Candidatus Roizmanbacteria bacterium RIFCSPLOWO2_02_FULL_36_11]